MKAAVSSAILVVACVALAGCALGGAAKAPPLRTGREFLVAPQREEAGFGLYSYLVFASTPTDASRDRYRAAAEAYLETVPRMTDMLVYAPPSHLNIVYLPVRITPPPELSALPSGSTGPELANGAQWVLEHYDYARASAVLAAVPGRHSEGPYLVSARKPLTESERLAGEYGVQDLSAAPPDLVRAWVKEFIERSAQDDPFAGGDARDLILTMRGLVRQSVRQWPQLLSKVDGWVTWAN